MDGTIAECDRVGDHERDYSGKARRHGVNIQAVTDPAGELIWYSPALPGRTVDITAARTTRIIEALSTTGLTTWADRAFQAAGRHIRVPIRVPKLKRWQNRVCVHMAESERHHSHPCELLAPAERRATATRARHNAADLRRLAAQITTLTDLPTAARRSLDALHTALGHDDPADLVAPLTATRPHLAAAHPDLTARLDHLTDPQ